MTEEFNLSDKIFNAWEGYKGNIDTKDVKEFIKRREARIRNQLRIHWLWLKDKPLNEVEDFIVAVANAEAGDKLK